MPTIIGIGAVGAMGFTACDRDTVAPEAKGLKLAVAPLQLAGIEFACYDILVENAAGPVVALGDPVVAAYVGGVRADQGAICSDQYGNGAGGGITYIAPCDASPDADTDPDGTGGKPGVQNTVTLWVDGLYNAQKVAIGTGSWQNPCGTDGCDLDFDCIANTDTLVEFNFTILRDAQQGFFDVAVNFEDIFCSAKVDCQYAGVDGAPGPYIRLLHDRDGDRTLTAVAAVACTGGDFEGETGEGRTNLYATSLVVDCGAAGSTAFDVSGEGNFYGPLAARPPGIEQVMVFRGLESLFNNATDANADKMYWNVAVGFTEYANSAPGAPLLVNPDCSLRWSVTASKGPIEDVFAKDNVTYPYIQADVDISNETGNVTCGQHPVNGGNGVSTEYTALDSGLPSDFSFHMQQVQGAAVVNSWVAQP